MQQANELVGAAARDAAHAVSNGVLGSDVDAAALKAIEPVRVARDVDGKLASLHPGGEDEVVVYFADPHGFLVLAYPLGYDANLLRKDLQRAIKS